MAKEKADIKDYEMMTVEVLRNLAEYRDISVPKNAKKDDIIKILVRSDKQEARSEGKPDPAPPPPTAEFRIKGNEGEGKRMFQLVPHEKVWLTKAEAKDAGLYWKD